MVWFCVNGLVLGYTVAVLLLLVTTIVMVGIIRCIPTACDYHHCRCLGRRGAVDSCSMWSGSL